MVEYNPESGTTFGTIIPVETFPASLSIEHYSKGDLNIRDSYKIENVSKEV